MLSSLKRQLGLGFHKPFRCGCLEMMDSCACVEKSGKHNRRKACNCMRQDIVRS